MLEYILFFIGIAILLKGADLLIDGASALARKLGISSLVIGLTIVALGTSLPELIVNVMAAISGNTDIAFGNIIGSNISNILLILGFTAILSTLKVQNSTIWKEIPLSILAPIILLILSSVYFLDGIQLNYIYRFGGLILLIFFGIFMYYVYELSKSSRSLDTSDSKEKMSYKTITIYIILGLIGLYLGGQWVVNGAIAFARLFGMSEYLISLTIVAIGTSLPELVTCIVAAMKKQADLAIGNIIGSNIFNIFLVFGITSVITPLKIPQFAIVDLIFLIFISFLLFLFMFVGKKNEISRKEGIIFVTLYILFIVFVMFR